MCLPRLHVKGALREAVRHPRMEGAGRGSASTACVRGVAWVALWPSFLSAAYAWRVLVEGRRPDVHSLCEAGGLAACGDDVAQDLQLHRSRSRRRAEAQLAFLPSSSCTSISTSLIPLRPCSPVDPVGIFPPASLATARLHRYSPITSTRPLLCCDHARLSQSHSHRDSDWRYAFSCFLSFTVATTTRSLLLCNCHV